MPILKTFGTWNYSKRLILPTPKGPQKKKWEKSGSPKKQMHAESAPFCRSPFYGEGQGQSIRLVLLCQCIVEVSLKRDIHKKKMKNPTAGVAGTIFSWVNIACYCLSGTKKIFCMVFRLHAMMFASISARFISWWQWQWWQWWQYHQCSRQLWACRLCRLSLFILSVGVIQINCHLMDDFVGKFCTEF